MTRNDGGPAFPNSDGTMSDGEQTVTLTSTTVGMSLRDWLAGQALSGDLAATPNCRPSMIGMAERAYAYADAMLAERLKP